MISIKKIFLPLIIFLGSNLSGQEFLVTVSPVTALPAIIDTLNEVKFIQGSPAFRTFDHVHNKFFFKGQNSRHLQVEKGKKYRATVVRK